MLERYKPATSRRTRLLLASLIWTVVGTGLLTAGVRWALSGGHRWATPALLLALAAGWVKGALVLSRRARSNAERIAAGPDILCVGGVFTWGAWALVAVMMSGGWMLRHSGLPLFWLGLIYVFAGSALLLASTVSWVHVRRLGPAGTKAGSAEGG
jgi:hypothetical protein